MSTPLSDREGLPSVEDVQAKVQSLADSAELGSAAALACWMILEKGFPLIRAKKTASKKYSVTQVGVERLVRKVIPAWYFEDRMRAYSAKIPATSKPESVLKRNQKRLNQELEKQKNRHISDL